jgi:hypothetical protein
MFANLPASIQELIILHLESDNFPAAKQVYNRYLLSESSQSPSQQVQSSEEKL